MNLFVLEASVNQVTEEPVPLLTSAAEKQRAVRGKQYLVTSVANAFERVICDEGHKVKNPSTHQARAISQLQAKYKWILSATPLINKAVDLLGYLVLLWQPEWAGDWDEYDTLVDAYKSVKDDDPVERRLFILDPRRFRKVESKGVVNQEAIYYALPRIHALLEMRRTMATEMETVWEGMSSMTPFMETC
jgi:hypothetical protein